MTPTASKTARTALSVNLNKVALVRNTRHLGIPSVTRAARLCLEAGAQGITVHPRPDERHIRADDVHRLSEVLATWPEPREFNIEGNPFHNLMDFVRQLRPTQATFVPDSEGQFTSDHGWSFPQDAERLRPLIGECKALGVRVSLFMDPVPGQMAAAKAVGADRVELYTEPYAAAFGTERQAAELRRYAAAAEAAQRAGEPGDGVAELGVGEPLDRARDGAVVDQREPVAVPGVDVAVERVVAGVEPTAGEPAVVRRVGAVERLRRYDVPVDRGRGLAPEAVRVREAAGVGVGVRTGRGHGTSRRARAARPPA